MRKAMLTWIDEEIAEVEASLCGASAMLGFDSVEAWQHFSRKQVFYLNSLMSLRQQYCSLVATE